MKNRDHAGRKATVSIPADLFEWGEQERSRLAVTRSAFVTLLYRRYREESIVRERVARYAAAYGRQPDGEQEHRWAERAADALAELYDDE